MSYKLNTNPTISAWAGCESCAVTIEVKGWQQKTFSAEAEWESGLMCPVCGDHLRPESLSYDCVDS